MTHQSNSLLDILLPKYKTDINNVESVKDKEKIIERINNIQDQKIAQYIYNFIYEYHARFNKNVKKLPTKEGSVPYKGKIDKLDKSTSIANITFDFNRFPLELQNLVFMLLEYIDEKGGT